MQTTYEAGVDNAWHCVAQPARAYIWRGKLVSKTRFALCGTRIPEEVKPPPMDICKDCMTIMNVRNKLLTSAGIYT